VAFDHRTLVVEFYAGSGLVVVGRPARDLSHLGRSKHLSRETPRRDLEPSTCGRASLSDHGGNVTRAYWIALREHLWAERTAAEGP
jgi:hypothetical protein